MSRDSCIHKSTHQDHGPSHRVRANHDLLLVGPPEKLDLGLEPAEVGIADLDIVV
jgi:hypothetical protein